MSQLWPLSPDYGFWRWRCNSFEMFKTIGAIVRKCLIMGQHIMDGVQWCLDAIEPSQWEANWRLPQNKRGLLQKNGSKNDTRRRCIMWPSHVHCTCWGGVAVMKEKESKIFLESQQLTQREKEREKEYRIYKESQQLTQRGIKIYLEL